ncbi:MAG: glycogen/starch synthase [Muribaculaceae bacterium]|nr:glycogen/starch synthase [Muribaculaceae bacterium]
MAKKLTQKDSGVFDNIDLLFETSWEVCNKIGGIYTVLSTKARELQKAYGDKLIFIGPDVWTEDNPSPSFIERKTLLNRASIKMELPNGIKIRTGRWKIPGSPIVVLVDFKSMFAELNDIYGDMWSLYGVESLHAYGDYDESCAFAVASAIVAIGLTSYLKADPSRVIAHFDEWTTGMGLLFLKANMPETATIFTTHATSIGRSICGNGKNLYQYFEGYNGDQMAQELNMEAKHSLEKTAAREADCFTTVSDVTARECTQLLNVKPQVVTPNGFEPDFVPDDNKYSRLRKAGRKHILNIAGALTGKKYSDDTLIVATSGRNEYRNKGLDLFIDSMIELGGKFNTCKHDIVALILVPAWMKEPNGALLINLKHEGHEKADCDFMTHRLNNEDNDCVCTRLRSLRMDNRGGDVKLIYIPCYLDGHDGIVDISYYDLLPALDLTVFPSYYEPWGYTPLESIAFSVPTITTDKAGFGQWIENNFPNEILNTGVKVLQREDTNYLNNASQIAEEVSYYCGLDINRRSKAKEAAYKTSRKADWVFFIQDYYKAFQIALNNANLRDKKH